MAYDTFTLPVAPPFRLDLTVWVLRELSINVANSKIDLTNLEELTNEEAIELLSSLRGIGALVGRIRSLARLGKS